MKKALIFLLFCTGTVYSVEVVPRTVAAFYDGKTYVDSSVSEIRYYAEQPLNHLGIQLIYYDINNPLPELKNRQDVLGVITWFKGEHFGLDNGKFLEWSLEMLDAGKKIVVIGVPGFELIGSSELSLEDKNRFWNKIGIHDYETWVSDVYMFSYEVFNPRLLNFERFIEDVETPFQIKKVISPEVTSHVKGKLTGNRGKEGDLVITGPKGSFMAYRYGLFALYTEEIGEKRMWCVNPYEFFRIAFNTDAIPKLDPTTLAGRRIYFSHIDGDGWNNYPQNTQIQGEVWPKIAAETVYQEVILPFPDLPVTVGAIGADLDETWSGEKKSEDVAQLIYALPQVEGGSHTLSHPFQWSWFIDNDVGAEARYLSKIQTKRWDKNPEYHQFLPSTDKVFSDKLHENYDVPRGFVAKPFNLEDEIFGSLSIVKKYLPQNKKVEVFLWSGDCVPFEKAVRYTREAGVKNMNGGDARFDFINPSYAYVPPFGRRIGEELQIFCASSNENTYTELWTEKFWAFATVPETWFNTEVPIRVLPMNLYYHMYCSEKDSSLAALLKNVEYARSKEICPVRASEYIKGAEGFFFAELIKEGENTWGIKNRKSLQTVRFDHSTNQSVDFEKSSGVVGQRHYQGSLYVYLDASDSEPIISLKEGWALDREPREDAPYMVHGRWQVWNLNRENPNVLSMRVKGFGKGEMVWQVKKEGQYRIQTPDAETVANTSGGMLSFVIDDDAIDEKELIISYQDGS